jgi:hypothetical protein
VVVGEGFGSWLEYVAFTNHSTKRQEIYWHVGLHNPEWTVPTRGHILKSDSMNRKDSQMIRDKRYDEEETHKHEAEEVQRRDKQLRHARAGHKKK